MNFYNQTLPNRETLIIWIPVFGDCPYAEKPRTSYDTSEPVKIFELFLISVLSIALSFMLLVIRRSRRFHRNLEMIFANMFINFGLFVTGRTILIFYQLRIVLISGNMATDYPLILASFLWLHSVFNLSMFPLSVVIERIFAAKYIEEYEQRSLICIPLTIILIKFTLSLVSAYMVLMNFFYDFVIIAALALPAVTIFAGSAFIMLLILLRWNRLQLKTLMRTDTNREFTGHYLSRRFQITENIEVLVLLKKLMLVSCIGTAFIASVGGVAMCCTNESGLFARYLFSFFNMSPIIYQESYLLTIILLVGSWRDDFLYLLQKIVMCSAVRRQRKVFVDQVSHREQQGLYFEMYARNWK
ncbi:unnamed protein product, partial [Mesorhabditis spiculigera]